MTGNKRREWRVPTLAGEMLGGPNTVIHNDTELIVDWIKVVELKPGEIVLSRAELRNVLEAFSNNDEMICDTLDQIFGEET